MPSRGQSITVEYTAWDVSSNTPKTGDSANHTLRWIKDGTASAPTNSASEVDGTNAPGAYKLTLTATEAGCEFGMLAGKSSTANVVIIPVSVTFEQLPTAAPNASGGLLTYGASSGQLNPSSGKIPATLAHTDVTGNVPANVIQVDTVALGTHASGQLPADLKYVGGSALNSATAQIGANLVNVAGAALNTNLAQIGANVAGWGGSAAPAIATEADIADAIWDEATSGHVTAGTAGVALTDILTDTGTTLDGRIPAALVGGKMDSHVNDIAANAITATSIQDGAITNPKVDDDVDVNAKTISAGAISSTTFSAASIDAASIAPDAGAEISASVWSAAARTLTAATGFQVKKNTELAGFMFVMTDSTTHAPKASVSVSATRSIDGGSFGACTNAVAEVSSGWYKLTLSAADLNGTVIALRFTGVDSDDKNITIVTQA